MNRAAAPVAPPVAELAATRWRGALERALLDRALWVSPTDRVLDLGEGVERIGLYLAPEAAEVLVVDPDPAVVEAVRAEAERTGLSNVRCAVGDFRTPRPEGPFDVVVVFGALHRLADDELAAAAESLAAGVKPGGTLVVMEPVAADGAARSARPPGGAGAAAARLRPRDAYAALLARHFALTFRAPVCARLVPAFLAGAEAAAARLPGRLLGTADAAAARLPRALVTRAVDALTPLWVRVDPGLQAVEETLGSGRLARLLPPVPVLHELSLLRRRQPRPRTDTPELSVVMVARNEARSVTPAVWETLDALDAAGIDFELVLVDDGSTDATAARLAAVAAADPRARPAPAPRPLGPGGALRHGIQAARGNFVAWVPRDPALGPDGVLTLYRSRHDAALLTLAPPPREAAWPRQAVAQALDLLGRRARGPGPRPDVGLIFRRDAWLAHGPRDDEARQLTTAFRRNLRAAGLPIAEVALDADRPPPTGPLHCASDGAEPPASDPDRTPRRADS